MFNRIIYEYVYMNNNRRLAAVRSKNVKLKIFNTLSIYIRLER